MFRRSEEENGPDLPVVRSVVFTLTIRKRDGGDDEEGGDGENGSPVQSEAETGRREVSFKEGERKTEKLETNMRIRYSRLNIWSLCFCFLFSRCRMVPFRLMIVHMRKEVRVKESPAIKERMRRREAVSREISTVPIE